LKSDKCCAGCRLEQSREDIIRDIKVHTAGLKIFSLNIEEFVSGSVFSFYKTVAAFSFSLILFPVYRCTAQGEIWKAVPSSLPKWELKILGFPPYAKNGSKNVE
jgi:hypothetical protein